jgi:hypothetical protein
VYPFKPRKQSPYQYAMWANRSPYSGHRRFACAHLFATLAPLKLTKLFGLENQEAFRLFSNSLTFACNLLFSR